MLLNSFHKLGICNILFTSVGIALVIVTDGEFNELWVILAYSIISLVCFVSVDELRQVIDGMESDV